MESASSSGRGSPCGVSTQWKSRRTGSGELLQYRTDRPEITHPEQVEVVEQMVQIVDWETLSPTADQGTGFCVSLIKAVRETSEELRLPQFGFRPTEVAGRVDQARLTAWSGQDVARPQVSVNQTGRFGRH